jgi:hypothetical protein
MREVIHLTKSQSVFYQAYYSAFTTPPDGGATAWLLFSVLAHIFFQFHPEFAILRFIRMRGNPIGSLADVR